MMAAAPRFSGTTRKRRSPGPSDARREPALVIAHHPRLARAGGRLVLDPVTEVSRLEPAFGGEPLDDPFLSRRAIVVRRLDRGDVELDNAYGVPLAIGGAELPAGKRRRLTADEVERGVDVLVGERVVLWLCEGGDDEPGDDLGLLGRPRRSNSARVTECLRIRRSPADAIVALAANCDDVPCHRPCSTHDTGNVSLRRAPTSADEVSTRFCFAPTRWSPSTSSTRSLLRLCATSRSTAPPPSSSWISSEPVAMASEPSWYATGASSVKSGSTVTAR